MTQVLGQIGGANYSPTAGQTAATNQVVNEATGLPSYASQAENTLGGLFSANTGPEQTMVSNAEGTTAGMLNAYLNPNYTNPMNVPGFSQAMSTIGQQTQQNVDSLFSAAGRDPAGNADAGKAAGIAVSNAESPYIASEYNSLVGQQQGAGQNLVSNAGNAATEEANLSTLPLTLGLEGMSGVSSLPGIVTQPGTAASTAANLQAGLPLTNLSGIEGLLDPVAALGGQTNSQGTQTTQTSALSNILSGGLGLAGLLAAPMTGGTSLLGTLASGFNQLGSPNWAGGPE